MVKRKHFKSGLEREREKQGSSSWSNSKDAFVPCWIAWVQSQNLAPNSSFLLMQTPGGRSDGSDSWVSATCIGNLDSVPSVGFDLAQPQTLEVLGK